MSGVAILDFAASPVVGMIVPADPGRRGAVPPAEAGRCEAGTIEFSESRPVSVARRVGSVLIGAVIH